MPWSPPATRSSWTSAPRRQSWRSGFSRHWQSKESVNRADVAGVRTRRQHQDRPMRFCSLPRRLTATLVAAIGISMFSSANAARPSFLCSKAKSWVEKTICASDTLSELDMELATDYARLLKVLSGDAEKAFSAEQRRWWAERGSCKKEADPRGCLEKRYQARIATLTSRPDYPGDQPRPREEF